MTGLSANGMTIKRLEEIKADLDNGLQIIFGQELSLDPSSPESQMNGQIAEDISVLYELAQAVYAGLNPNTAVGNMLDLVSQIRGVLRKPATPSTVGIDLTGAAGATIPAGTLFAATGIPNITFSLNEARTLPASGTVTCTTTGDISVPAGTLTTIVNPVSGLTSVTNPLDGNVGSNVETDAELRVRSNASTALPSEAILNGMQAGISAVDGVTDSKVIENDTDILDAVTGVNPHSMHAIVKGGADEDIAQVIFDKKSLGCGMDGDVIVSIEDFNGFPHNIVFSRPTEIPIFVHLDLRELSGWDVSLEQFIKEAIVDFAEGVGNCDFDGYQIGEDVHSSQLYAAVLNYNAFSVNDILIGVAATPSGSDVTINPSEIATFRVEDITIVSAP